MARISDTIEKFIKNMINEQEENQVLIQRNELADKFCCAPSQINYVLTTRFTYEKGYLIESRRGGGGYIVITKVTYDNKERRLDIINNSIGSSITYNGAISILDHLRESRSITDNEYEIMKISLNDRTLTSVLDKNRVRADILKGMITVILS
ncbi:CtsR family transcriptional regulator [Clostridium chauvoei]|uniref:Transcriptional regulator CtsR n=2 Tax=Clostridium chauvoei TaxID=46867 RepID=S6FD52_9CLOT|nr:CtsR family transcriptional regulator [Clostridium chauvoei]ATD53903.1 CtsR family transcriptional regulator [Clostridium chauvoei]ATD58292.1 CtsR family transcriptional regulator [Clostridium chauvoei]MBX7280547.1 CtsR family transcriptional regulator [Clostridium chauvoei]MBX7283125.1 CtsR family transcriptional regulator [Clostridium chauvoei]MBX7285345.1 CtsR family transcriptional regulator [Clostridium chauvoei]